MASEKQIDKGGSSRLRDLHEHYRERGFYKYVGRNVLLIILVYAVVVLLFFLVSRHLVDFNAIFQAIIDSLTDRFVLILFFISESILGLIPVDLFVIWTQKFEHPLPYLVLLGVLSYSGGVISYQIGLWISRWPRVRAYTERRLRSYVEFTRKWGGAFIVIAALFPFTPFSMVVIAVTLLRFPFRLFLLYAMARLIRFAAQGVIFFDILNMDQWAV
jgi:membrane protein YqaA with SNARE-associated domain